MAVVEELASPRYAGRRTGSEGGRAARAYVRDGFAEIGLEPAGTAGYEQPFAFGEYRDAANLVGLVRGGRPELKAFVITAHYDHLGIREGATFHGADDNASGVAALLAIARAVKDAPLRRTAVFAALDAEELGLQGAKALVARPPVPLARVALNINFDMLARNDRNEIYAAGTYHHPWLRPLLEDVQRRAAVTIRFGHDRPGTGDDDWTLQSDHGVFHQAGVPFVYFGVEDHPDYHRPTDTADKIDESFFNNVVGMALEAVRRLDREEL
jgi:Zn-dependent M28 family amino/carboxypeptidase